MGFDVGFESKKREKSGEKKKPRYKSCSITLLTIASFLFRTLLLVF